MLPYGVTRPQWVNFHKLRPGPLFNIIKTSYQYRKSHCGDKTIIRPSYLNNGIFYTGKKTSLFWIRPQGPKCLVISVLHRALLLITYSVSNSHFLKPDTKVDQAYDVKHQARFDNMTCPHYHESLSLLVNIQVLELMQMHPKERLRWVILTASWFIAIDVGQFFPENSPRFPWHILIFSWRGPVDL